MGNTCKTIKQFVVSYVEWENTSLLLYQNIAKHHPLELVHIIKYKNKNPHYYIKATHLSIPDRVHVRIKCMFATTIRKKIVIGVDYCGYYPYGMDHPNIHLFSFEDNEWTRVYPDETRKVYTGSTVYKDIDFEKNYKVMWSPIGESDVVKIYVGKRGESNCIEILHFDKKEPDSRLTYSTYCYVAPEEIRCLRNFGIVQRRKSEILLVGGQRECDYDQFNAYYGEDEYGQYYDEDDGPFYVPNETIWAGVLSTANSDVIWKDTGHIVPFLGNTLFCINDNIYLSHIEGNVPHLATKNTSHRYNCNTQEYQKNVFSVLPEWHVYPGTCGNIVNVDATKDLVLMAVRKEYWAINNGYKRYFKRQILSFTENQGFHEITHFNHDHKTKYPEFKRNIECLECECIKHFGIDDRQIFILPILQ